MPCHVCSSENTTQARFRRECGTTPRGVPARRDAAALSANTTYRRRFGRGHNPLGRFGGSALLLGLLSGTLLAFGGTVAGAETIPTAPASLVASARLLPATTVAAFTVNTANAGNQAASLRALEDALSARLGGASGAAGANAACTGATTRLLGQLGGNVTVAVTNGNALRALNSASSALRDSLVTLVRLAQPKEPPALISPKTIGSTRILEHYAGASVYAIHLDRDCNGGAVANASVLYATTLSGQLALAPARATLEQLIATSQHGGQSLSANASYRRLASRGGIGFLYVDGAALQRQAPQALQLAAGLLSAAGGDTGNVLSALSQPGPIGVTLTTMAKGLDLGITILSPDGTSQLYDGHITDLSLDQLSSLLGGI